MTVITRQLAHLVLSLADAHQTLLQRLNVGENSQEPRPRVSIDLAAARTLGRVGLAAPVYDAAGVQTISRQLLGALECSAPVLEALAGKLTGEPSRMAQVTAAAQRQLLADHDAQARQATVVGENWAASEDTDAKGQKGIRIDTAEVSLAAWLPYGLDAEGPGRAQAMARRLLACVRACEGIPTDLLESLEPGELDAAVNDGDRDPSHPMLGR